MILTIIVLAFGLWLFVQLAWIVVEILSGGVKSILPEEMIVRATEELQAEPGPDLYQLARMDEWLR